MNRSSLLVPGQVTKPQEVNGTNGSAPSPVTDVTAKQAEPSSDSEQDEAGDTDESVSRESPRRHGNHGRDGKAAVSGPDVHSRGLCRRVGSPGPNGAALPVLREERPRPQLHAVQALLLYFLRPRVRRDLIAAVTFLERMWSPALNAFFTPATGSTFA